MLFRSITVLLDQVVDFDLTKREVVLQTKRLPYDYLVLATGAQHSYFGKDGWAAYASGLKTIEDATEIRRRLLTAFERAEAADQPAERAAWMTFVIVGGGPTGVELAGAIAELARHGLDKEFRTIDPTSATVVCLFLNIFTPAINRGNAVDERRRPVFVWIHGGGNVDGESNDYDGSKLAAQGNIVVVTFNYRLGLLGFFAHPAIDAEGHLFGVPLQRY